MLSLPITIFKLSFRLFVNCDRTKQSFKHEFSSQSLVTYWQTLRRCRLHTASQYWLGETWRAIGLDNRCRASFNCSDSLQHRNLLSLCRGAEGGVDTCQRNWVNFPFKQVTSSCLFFFIVLPISNKFSISRSLALFSSDFTFRSQGHWMCKRTRKFYLTIW